MSNAEYTKYLKSAEWASVKIDLFANRGRKCELCGIDKKLQVHHKTYKNIFNENPEDLIILCEACHKDEHGMIKKGNKFVKKKKSLSLAQKVFLKKSKLKKANTKYG